MKKTGWFRFYNRMIDSPQVLELSDSEFRLIVSLWCLASTAEAGGHIPFSAPLIRRRLAPDHSVEAVEAMIAHLITLDLLQPAEGGYTVPRWLDHQYDYKSWQPSARVAQKRQERAASPDQPEPTPPQDTRGFVASEVQAVASMSQAESNTDIDVDQDLDLDGDPTGKIPVSSAPARDEPGTPVKLQKRAPPVKPNIPLPNPYPLTERMRVWIAQDVPELVATLDTEHAQFCRHYWARDKERRSDWLPQWEKWMADAVGRFAPKSTSALAVTGGPHAAPKRSVERETDNLSAIARARRARNTPADGSADSGPPERHGGFAVVDSPSLPPAHPRRGYLAG